MVWSCEKKSRKWSDESCYGDEDAGQTSERWDEKEESKYWQMNEEWAKHTSRPKGVDEATKQATYTGIWLENVRIRCVLYKKIECSRYTFWVACMDIYGYYCSLLHRHAWLSDCDHTDISAMLLGSSQSLAVQIVWASFVKKKNGSWLLMYHCLPTRNF